MMKKKPIKFTQVNATDKNLTTGCKKELLVFLAKDHDYEMRNTQPKIAMMDLAILSSIFNIGFVIYQAETTANSTLVFHPHRQRAWLETIKIIPQIKISFDKKDSHQKSIHFIALSYHDNDKYSYISCDNLPTALHDAEIFVKSLTSGFQRGQSIELAKEWIKDRTFKEHEEFIANSNEWAIDDMTDQLTEEIIYTFVRMIDPYSVKYREHNPDGVLSVDGNIVINYESMRSLKPGIWLKQHLIDAFVKSLTSIKDVARGKLVLISPTDLAEIALVRHDHTFNLDKRQDTRTYNYATYKCQSLIERINKAQDVCIIVHNNGGHYFYVEFSMMNALTNQKFELKIADSLYSGKKLSWRGYHAKLKDTQILLLLKELRPHFSYNFDEAEEVTIQPDMYECGVHCCRRMYSRVINRKIIPKNEIDEKLGTPIIFRLKIAQMVIENASYITLYASETGSFPVNFDEDEMPTTIGLKIVTFDIKRKSQYPDEKDVDVTGLLETNKINNYIIDDTEFENEIFKSNESFVGKSSNESTWSESINSGDKYHSNKFGLDVLDMKDKDVIDIKSTEKKPPTNLKFKINTKDGDDGDELDTEVQQITKRKIAYLTTETNSYYKRMREAGIIKEGTNSGKIEKYVKKQPRIDNKKKDFVQILNNKYDIAMLEDDWDKPKSSNYAEHVELDLVEKQKDDLVNRYLQPKIQELLLENPNENEVTMNEHWHEFYFLPSQYEAEETEVRDDENGPRIDVLLQTMDNEIALVQQEYNSTLVEFKRENKKKRRIITKKVAKLHEKLVDLKAEVSIRTFERQKVKIFHKSNSIYAIKIEGDVDNEYTWKYLAVYKGDDDKYYESRVSYQWLVDNFEESYLEALKEHKMMGGYMIYNDSELQYVRKFPIEDYIKDKTHRFNQALWKYQIKDKSMKIWSLRATVTFDKKTFDKEHTNTDHNPLDVSIITTFSVCFQKTNRKKVQVTKKISIT